MAERERAISTAKKRRGIARASLTRLDTKLKELEDRSEPDPVVRLESVRQTKTKLASLDSDFRTHHFNLVDLLEERAELDAEQAVLDEQDDRVAGLSTRIECLINRLSTSPPSTRPVLTDSRGVTSRRLRQLERRLSTVNDTLSTDPTDECTVRQLEEEISDLKSELRSITPELASLDLPDDDELMKLEKSMRESMYKCSLKAKRLLSAKPAAFTTSTTDALGVKLPKIDVPRFNGNILSWRSFWEQFHVAIHCRTSLSKAEKLAYLQSSLKDGSAKSVIDGLSQSGDHYDEAVATLRARYDRPRLVHQTHVQMIVEAPGLKEGTGRELRRLHDTVQQHLRALRSMDYEPSGPFITSLLELKLDPTTMFEWQRASQGRTEVPPYSELLDFLDLRAQASEAKVTEPYKRSVKLEYRKTTPPVKPVQFSSTVGDTCCLQFRQAPPLLLSCVQINAP